MDKEVEKYWDSKTPSEKLPIIAVLEIHRGLLCHPFYMLPRSDKEKIENYMNPKEEEERQNSDPKEFQMQAIENVRSILDEIESLRTSVANQEVREEIYRNWIKHFVLKYGITVEMVGVMGLERSREEFDTCSADNRTLYIGALDIKLE